MSRPLPAPQGAPLAAPSPLDAKAAELSAWVAAQFETLRRSIGQQFRWQFRGKARR